MSIDLSATDLTALDTTEVQARLLRIENLVDGLGVGVETRRGFIRDFVIRLQSILGQALSDQLEVVGASLNPLAVASDATLDSAVLDATAVYYGLTRYVAATNSGSIGIVISANQTTIIPRGGALGAQRCLQRHGLARLP